MVSDAVFDSIETKTGVRVRRANYKTISGSGIFVQVLDSTHMQGFGGLIDQVACGTEQERETFLVHIVEWLSANPGAGSSIVDRGRQAVEYTLSKVS